MTLEKTASSVALLKKPLDGVSLVYKVSEATHSQAKAQPHAKADKRSSLPKRVVIPIALSNTREPRARGLTNGQHRQTDILRDVRLPVDKSLTLGELHDLACGETEQGANYDAEDHLVGTGVSDHRAESTYMV